MTCLVMLMLFADTAALVETANAHFRDGDFLAAEKAFLEARVDHPESPVLAFNLGSTYLAMEDFPKARTELQKALKTRDPGLEAKIQFNLGHTHLAEGKTGLQDLSDPEKVKRTVELLRQAIIHFRDVLRLQPEHGDAKKNIVLTTQLLKDYMDRVKRHQEAQKKKEEEEKGEDLAAILKELIKKQKAEKERTDGMVTTLGEKAPFEPQAARLEAIKKAMSAADTKPAEDGMAELLADPGFVEGAPALQEAKNNLAGPEANLEKAKDALNRASAAVERQITTRLEKAKDDHATDVKHQTEINGKTLGVIMQLENQITGQNSAGIQKLSPGQPQGQPQQPQGPPMPPEMKAVFEKVKAKLQEATPVQLDALAALQKGHDRTDSLREAADKQQTSADKLQEALDLLPKDEQKPDQNQQKQDQNKDQQKKEDEKNKENQQQKQQKAISKKQAEDMMRQIKEKERQKKKEKQEQLLRAGGRRQVDKDW